MSYSFTAANGHYMNKYGALAYSVAAFSWLAWVRVVASSPNKAIFRLCDNVDSTQQTYVWLQANNQMVEEWGSGALEDYIGTGINPTSDAWVMLYGRSNSASNKRIGWNAGNEPAPGGSVSPAIGGSNLFVGSRDTGTTYPFNGKMAMLAFYNYYLSDSDLTALLSAVPSAHAGSYAHCLEFWDFRTDQGTSTITGVKNGMVLTLGGTTGTPTYNADNPTLSATTKKLRLTTHQSAVGATNVKGSVFAAPTTEPLHGAPIGQFSGKTFEAALESGKAILKVPVSDFGGSSLTTSDTPVAIVKTDTRSTTVIPCSVIEE